MRVTFPVESRPDLMASALVPALSGSGFIGAIELPNLPEELIVLPVRTHHQRRGCDALVRRMYATRGYRFSPKDTGTRDARSITLAVLDDDEPVATLTITRDSDHGLLAEDLYGPEIAAMRRPSRVLSEITRLAVAPEVNHPALSQLLFDAAHRYALAHLDCTDVFIEVNPRHSGYYQKRFGFRQVGDLRTCPRVNAPAVLLHRPVPTTLFR